MKKLYDIHRMRLTPKIQTWGTILLRMSIRFLHVHEVIRSKSIDIKKLGFVTIIYGFVAKYHPEIYGKTLSIPMMYGNTYTQNLNIRPSNQIR